MVEAEGVAPDDNHKSELTYNRTSGLTGEVTARALPTSAIFCQREPPSRSAICSDGGFGMAFRVGIDTGGTFTDIVLVDDATGELHTAKLAPLPATRVWPLSRDCAASGARRNRSHPSCSERRSPPMPPCSGKARGSCT